MMRDWIRWLLAGKPKHTYIEDLRRPGECYWCGLSPKYYWHYR